MRYTSMKSQNARKSGIGVTIAASAGAQTARFGRLGPHAPMPELEDHSLDTASLFAEAIREHLDLKARNAELDGDMPIQRYLNGDPLENHPLFKSEEQARIEETIDGEVPAPVELSSERLPWPGEETVDEVEGAALDETLWTGRPRDFDWGD
jgi:hypothetical protein